MSVTKIVAPASPTRSPKITEREPEKPRGRKRRVALQSLPRGGLSVTSWLHRRGIEREE